jgi:antitoxin VapB
VNKPQKKKGPTLYVKNPTARKLAERVAKRMGVSLSDAVIRALEEKLLHIAPSLDRGRIDAICAEIRTLPVIDSRSPDEILGYDEFGIPR